MKILKSIIVSFILTMVFTTPAFAYITKDGYIPNMVGFYSTGINKVDTTINLGDILGGEIVNMFPNIKGYKVIIKYNIIWDNASVAGLTTFKEKTIEIKKQSIRSMDKVLNHEIQHIIEYESGVRYKNIEGEHDTLPVEQLPTINEILYDTERFGTAWLDKKIQLFSIPDTDEARIRLGHLKAAKKYLIPQL